MRIPVIATHLLCVFIDITLSESMRHFKISALFEEKSNHTELKEVFNRTLYSLYSSQKPDVAVELRPLFETIDLSNSFTVSNTKPTGGHIFTKLARFIGFNVPFNNFSVTPTRYLPVAVRTQTDFLAAVSPECYAADTDHCIPLSHIVRTLSTPVLPLSIIAERHAGDEKFIICSFLVCDHLQDGAYTIIGMSQVCALSTIQSFTDYFQVPYITLSMALNVTKNISSIPYQLYMMPQYIEGLLYLILRKEWTKVIYLYDNDEGLMRLQQIFQAFNAREIEHVDFHVKRVRNVHHCVQVLKDMFEIVKDIPRTREGHLLRIVLDIPIKDCEKVISEVRSENSTMKPNRFHFILADLGISDIRKDIMKSGLNITGYDLGPYNLNLAGGIINLTLEKALVIDTAKLVFETLNKIRHLNNGVSDEKCRTAAPKYKPGPAVMNTLRNTKFKGLTGNVEFDNRGFRKNFSLYLFETTMNMGISKVGNYSREGGLTIHDPESVYTSPSNRTTNSTEIRRVTTVMDPPYVMLKKSSEHLREQALDKTKRFCGKEHFEGFCIDLAEKISQYVKFDYNICLVKDGFYGKKLADETWNGMVGELTKNEADLAIAPITISSARERVVDFTKPFMSLGISIMIKKPSNTKAHVFSFMDPLSYEIWMCILFAYVGVSVVLFLVSRFSPSEWHVEEDSNITNDFTISNSLWYSLGAFMQQGCDISPKAVSGRIAGSVWWFFTLIIISSYTANLAAFLTVSRMNTPIESAEDLAKQTNIQYGVLEDGTTRDFFKHTKVAIYERMWAYMTSANPDVFVKNNSEGINRVREQNGKYAFLVESTINEYTNLQKPCDTMKVGSNLDSKGYGIATPVGSSLRDELTLAVLHFRETGVLQEMKKKWWDKSSDCPPAKSNSDGTQTALTLNNVAGIFYILISGLTMAVIIAGCEFLYKSIVDSKKSQSSFGSVLKSKARLSFRGSIDNDSPEASEPIRKTMATYTYTGPPQLPGFDPYPDTNNTHTQV